MKKLFLLIPALVLAIALNAVTPGTQALRAAYNSAEAGSTLVLEAGTYEETERIEFTKSMTIMAAEGAEVIVKTYKDNPLTLGAEVKFIGIQFDGSEMGTREYFIRSYDATAGNELHFENCEVYNFPSATYLINAASDARSLDSIIINNCYFHNNGNDAIYVNGAAASKGVIITNSTFANSSASHSIIEVRNAGTVAEDIELTVDHCTFYNNTFGDGDYSNIRANKLAKSYISNCIFAHSEAYAKYAAYSYGGTISNCLTYNLTSGYRDWSPCAVFSNNITADPLFNDLANNKYTFDGNWTTMSISPARGAATDGSDLGDPRWYSAEVLPNVDFATPYQFVGTKAVLAGQIGLNTNDHIEYYDTEDKGTATWKIHATRACVLSGALNMETGSSSGHKFKVVVLDADGNSIGELAEPSQTGADGNIALPNQIALPAAGNYTIILYNLTAWSSAKIEGVTFSYVGGAVQAMPGTTDIDDAWFSSNGTRTAGEKIVIPSGHQHEGWVKWNVSFANTANYKAKVNINCDNGHDYTVALYEDEDDLTPITWGEGKQTEDASPLDLGAKEVPAGNYILKVTNAVQHSHAELVSVQFVNAGGGLVDIPGDITLTEAILSSRAYIDGNGEIRFTSDAEHGHVTEESVAWRVNVSKAGYYKFTTSVNSNNGHSYLVSVYNADETILKGSVPQSGDDIWGAPKTFSTDNIYLEEGEYRIKVQNTTNNSNGRIVSISASYEGGAVVNIPNVAIPFADAILSENATRNLESVPQEIHFGSPNASQYAQWNIHAVAGLYTFTFDVVGTNYGTYKLDILEGNDNIFTYMQGKQGSGQVTISKVFIPAEGDYVLQIANTNSGADGYLTSLAATAATDVFVLDENTEDDGSIAAAAETSDQYTFLLKRSFTADKYYTICLPVSSWDSELKLAFGADYELWQMSSATQSGDEIALNFEQITSFSAGKPYIIKPSVDIENPILYNKKDIKNYTNNNVQSFSAADFIGTFYKSEIPAGENNLYLQNNELFYNETYNTPIKGTRAWIRLKPQGGANNVKAARIVLGGKVATDISLVNGELVDGTVKTIENGQLVIIRDGVRYNVMGVKLQ